MADTWEIWPPAAPELTYGSDALETDLLDKFIGRAAHVDVPRKPAVPLSEAQKQKLLMAAVIVLGSTFVYFQSR